MPEGWSEIENSHLLKGTCTAEGCISDTLAAPGQTETAMCGPHRMIDAEIKTRGGTTMQQFSAPSGVTQAFRKKDWRRGDDGVIRDRWGRYVLPDPVTGVLREFTRVSTLKDVLSNSWNIRMWDRRTTAYGMAKNPDLAAQAAQAVPGPDGRFEPNNPWREHLDRVAKLAFVAGGGEAGASKGTDWHRWRELYDAAELDENEAPDGTYETLRVRNREMQRHGLTVPAGMSERVVIIPELDAAGTFDELFEAADGTLFIGDEKSQRAFYDGGLLEAIQLAAYSRAKWIVDVKAVGNDPAANLAALTPMPDVDQNTAKIIWVPIGKAYAEVKNVDLTEAWGWAQLAVRLREARKGEWVTTAPAPTVDVSTFPAATPEQLAAEFQALSMVAADSGSDLCKGDGHAWNCEKVHESGVKTIREILVQRIEGLKDAPDAETELNAMWGVQNPLGHWDSGLTDLGLKVLGRA